MTRKTQLAIVLTAVMLSSFPAMSISSPGGAETAREAVTLPRTEVHQIRSEINGRDYEIQVAFPPGYASNGSVRYPVLYVLDARWWFGIVAETHAAMQFVGELPPMILVGIKGPGETDPEYLTKRVLDLTPTRDPGYEMNGHEVPSGGGEAFLRVLVEEVVPWAEARYPTDPNKRGLAGCSLGGLLAIHALLQSPTTFTHYLIGSPALWWDDGVMFQREVAYSTANKELDARVFMSAGTLEGPMLPDMLRMAENLKAREYAGLDLTSHIFMGETHFSAVPATMSRGMRVLFGEAE